MIKVYILVSGLFLSAPNDVGQPTELRFLFPQIPDKSHAIYLWNGATQSDTKLATPALVSIDNWGTTTIQRPAATQQPQLSALMTNPAGARMRSECAEAGTILAGKCQPTMNEAGVHGILRLEGTWHETPRKDCCGPTPPIDAPSSCLFEFVDQAGNVSGAAGQKQLANAWRYESEVQDLKQIVIGSNIKLPALALSDSELCKRYGAEEGNCVVLWFHNDDKCANDMPTDHHFAHLYDLVESPPYWNDRLVPKLVNKEECTPCPTPSGPGQGGYGRCTGGGSGSGYP